MKGLRHIRQRNCRNKMFQLSSRRFHSSKLLLSVNSLKITLFSKKNCSLCDTAHTVMKNLYMEPGYSNNKFNVIDIEKPENKEWWNKYCFDIPVIHVEVRNDPNTVKKIFHRINEQNLRDLIKSFE